MTHILKDQSILVTGGAGSFGRAFVRYALSELASRVVVFSRNEAAQAAMRAEFADKRLRFLLGDIRDLARITEACRGIDIVIHAAALKRVEACEAEPNEAIATNVTGTQNVARACIANGVQRAVFLSTDKAASPNTLYGVTKLAAERIWLGANVYAAGTPTRFACSRYGNVIGSTGSVVPLFREQATSGVLTVTDRAMTRFFMSMDAAVDLVVLALTEMRGGEVFVPKLHSARIVDLAEAIAPGCKLRETGIRPGEKLHETLLTDDEFRLTYDCGSHFLLEPASRSWGDVTTPRGKRCDGGMVYRSDWGPRMSIEQLREMIAA